MNGITTAIFVSLIFIAPAFGHTIHKRLLENSKEPPTKETNLLNGTNLQVSTTPTTTMSSTQMLREPETIAGPSGQNWSLVSSTEAPEILVHPFVEATEVDQSNESDLKVLLKAVPIDEKLPTEKPQEPKHTNSSTPGESPTVLNILSQPLQIIKENCTCFSVRRPSSVKNSRKFENATTSLLSEVESEIGVLFEIAAGVLPKMNEFIGRKANETSTKDSQAAQPNGTEIIEVKIDEPPFFEDFIPYSPLEYLVNRPMPQETIIIQADSEGVDPLQLFPSLSHEFIHGPTPNVHNVAMELPNLTAQKNDNTKPLAA